MCVLSLYNCTRRFPIFLVQSGTTASSFHRRTDTCLGCHHLIAFFLPPVAQHNWPFLYFWFRYLFFSPAWTLLPSRSVSCPSTSTCPWIFSRSRASRPLAVVSPSLALRPSRSPRPSVRSIASLCWVRDHWKHLCLLCVCTHAFGSVGTCWVYFMCVWTGCVLRIVFVYRIVRSGLCQTYTHIIARAHGLWSQRMDYKHYFAFCSVTVGLNWALKKTPPKGTFG
jgi:hypothetical protein